MTARSSVRSGAVRRSRSMAPPALKRTKPSCVLERGDQHVHRPLRGNQPQRRRHVPPDPDVFFGVAQEVGERIDDVFAVADEHLARRALQQPVAHQRHQRRHEQEVAVARAEPSGALDRLRARPRGRRRTSAARAAAGTWCCRIWPSARATSTPDRRRLLARVGGELPQRALRQPCDPRSPGSRPARRPP